VGNNTLIKTELEGLKLFSRGKVGMYMKSKDKTPYRRNGQNIRL